MVWTNWIARFFEFEIWANRGYSRIFHFRLLEQFSGASFRFFYLPQVPTGWEKLMGDPAEDFEVYISYENPKNVDMAFIGSPSFLCCLTAEDKVGLSRDRFFCFYFFAVGGMLEEQFGELSLRFRQRLIEKIDELVEKNSG